MNQFELIYGKSEELRLFPHIIEFGMVKNSSIGQNKLPKSSANGVKFFYVSEGKFQWDIHNSKYTLYPGDLAVILPGQEFGSCHDVLEIGSFTWIHIHAQQRGMEEIALDAWSSLSENELLLISKILLLNSPLVIANFNDGGKILKCIQQELFGQEVGHYTRVNNQIDELFILIARQLTRQTNPGRDFSKIFMKLEEALRRDLSHQWTVEEMAALVGLGTTLFNNKVKSYSGFSPLNYLINIRISEAIKLLKKKDVSITDIALDIGFYSSQHFSTTFKKLIGYTPREYRKNNSYNE